MIRVTPPAARAVTAVTLRMGGRSAGLSQLDNGHVLVVMGGRRFDFSDAAQAQRVARNYVRSRHG